MECQCGDGDCGLCSMLRIALFVWFVERLLLSAILTFPLEGRRNTPFVVFSHVMDVGIPPLWFFTT